MIRSGGRDVRSCDRRRGPRVKLSIPVQFGQGAREAEGPCPCTGQSQNLGAGGVHLVTGEGGPFVPGERLMVSIAVPWEARRLFPFSRIVGPCRIVRVEEVSTTDNAKQTGLALSFSRDEMTLLGAVVTP